jgi:hypothetical protein
MRKKLLATTKPELGIGILPVQGVVILLMKICKFNCSTAGQVAFQSLKGEHRFQNGAAA